MIANIAPKISCPLLNILAIFIACKGNLKWIKKLLFWSNLGNWQSISQVIGRGWLSSGDYWKEGGEAGIDLSRGSGCLYKTKT